MNNKRRTVERAQPNLLSLYLQISVECLSQVRLVKGQREMFIERGKFSSRRLLVLTLQKVIMQMSSNHSKHESKCANRNAAAPNGESMSAFF